MTQSNIQIVEQYLQAYTDKDRAAIEAVVDGTFHFSSPRDNRLDRATYFGRCWKNSEATVGRKLIYCVADGDRVFVTYEAAWKSGKVTRNTEVFTLCDGKIMEVEVYFGWNVPHDAPDGGFIDMSGGTG